MTMTSRTQTMSASLCAISLSFSMYSESAVGSETEEPQLTAPAWFIEIPSVPTKFDWLLVHKGELLGGDIIAMYDERVEFDSDEVGVHKVKMKDIRWFRGTAHPQTNLA